MIVFKTREREKKKKRFLFYFMEQEIFLFEKNEFNQEVNQIRKDAKHM